MSVQLTIRDGRCRGWILGAALAVLAVVLLTASAPSARAEVPTFSAGFESDNLSQFSQIGVTGGTLATTRAVAYDGAVSALATYDGSGSNGYARTIENVSWPAGSDVWYGAAFLLPSGYAAALKGGNDIMRWDNYGAYESGADYGGVELWSDGRARLLLGKYTNDPGSVLTDTFSLPEGRWFWLEVHQRLSTTAGEAVNEVFVDGAPVVRSTAANSYGRPVDRLRTGIVSIADGRQTAPLSLHFDRVRFGASPLGPMGAAPPPSSPAPSTPSAPSAPSSPSTPAAPARPSATSRIVTLRVAWPARAARTIGASLRLPARPARVHGRAVVLRWEEPRRTRGARRWGGVALVSRTRARLVTGRIGHGARGHGRTFAVPTGRWFRLDVRRAANGVTGVTVDGRGAALARLGSPGRVGRLQFGHRSVRVRDAGWKR